MTIYRLLKNTFFILAIGLLSCQAQVKKAGNLRDAQSKPSFIWVGANQTQDYIPLLKNKKIGVVANPTSVIFKNKKDYSHLVDSLMSLKVKLKKVFSPEHGFRGNADAGEKIQDAKDPRTGLPIISLYGDNKKPTPEQLKGIDVMVFDLQDVGVRFYTYISTLHYVMEACAEQNIAVLVLDRPNPNAHYIDGPILEKEQQSFVGMHPVPIVYGMTIGEYAQMINGEKWLKNEVQCDLTVIKMKDYNHKTNYELPIKPSPNLPNSKAVNLYPSLCFFEGTNVSAGRGTALQFQVFGSPNLDGSLLPYRFTPKPNEGAKHPKHEGKLCYGKDLSNYRKLYEINLSWLLKAYMLTDNQDEFFNDFFIKLAGTKKLQEQIVQGLTEKQIKATWVDGLEEYKKMREKYLLY
jgi:uncharacterized protein YbbC (DUF1343 family)